MADPLPPHPIVIALGSNLGPRLDAFRRACAALEKLGVLPIRRSRLYWTRPWSPASSSDFAKVPSDKSVAAQPHQPHYLNAAILVRTSHRPSDLLARCRAVERSMGRFRKTRGEAGRLPQPRVIDLDLICYGNLRIDTAQLHLPHPRWRERDFVILPMLDLEVVPPASYQLSAIGYQRSVPLRSLGRERRFVESVSRWP